KRTETSTRDTLCDKDSPIILPKIDYPVTVISMAVGPKAKGDEEKISSGLSRLVEEDPTFQIHQNLETRQLVISGMGEQVNGMFFPGEERHGSAYGYLPFDLLGLIIGSSSPIIGPTQPVNVAAVIEHGFHQRGLACPTVADDGYTSK
ncbi:elongation factor G, partial [Candidatus Hakubella thermalkaliphila]